MDLEERVFEDIVSDIAARDSVEVEKAIPEQKKTFCFEVFFTDNERQIDKKLRKIERRFDLLRIQYENHWTNDDKKNEHHLNMKFWLPSEKISFGTTMQLTHLCTYVERYLDAKARIDNEYLSFISIRDFKNFFREDGVFNKICQLNDKDVLERNIQRYYNDEVIYKYYIARTEENFIRSYFGKKYDTYSYRTIPKMSSFANGRKFEWDYWKICHSKYDTLKSYKLIVTYTGLEEYSKLHSYYYKCDNPTPLNSLNAFKLQNRPILSSTVYELRLEWRFIFLFFVGLTEGSDFEWLVVDVSSNKYSRVVSLIQTLFGKRTKMLCKKILKEMFHGYKREYNERNRFAE